MYNEEGKYTVKAFFKQPCFSTKHTFTNEIKSRTYKKQTNKQKQKWAARILKTIQWIIF